MRCFIRIRRCQDLFRIFSREKNSPTVPAPIMPMRVVIVPMCTFNLFVGTGLDIVSGYVVHKYQLSMKSL